MQFRLKFALDNAAFGAGDERRVETARILRKVADYIEAGRWSGKCMDLNGNSVGEFGLD